MNPLTTNTGSREILVGKRAVAYSPIHIRISRRDQIHSKSGKATELVVETCEKLTDLNSKV